MIMISVLLKLLSPQTESQTRDEKTIWIKMIKKAYDGRLPETLQTLQTPTTSSRNLTFDISYRFQKVPW